MKFSKSLLLFFLGLFVSVSYGQNSELGLYLNKTKNEKVELFAKKQTIKVWTDSMVYIGKYEIIDTKNLKINGTIVPLSNITEIRAVKKKRRLVGLGFGGVGGLFVVGGGLLAILDGGITFATEIGLAAMLVVGLPLTSIGTLVAFAKPKYDLKSGKYSLIIQ